MLVLDRDDGFLYCLWQSSTAKHRGSTAKNVHSTPRNVHFTVCVRFVYGLSTVCLRFLD